MPAPHPAVNYAAIGILLTVVMGGGGWMMGEAGNAARTTSIQQSLATRISAMEERVNILNDRIALLTAKIERLDERTADGDKRAHQ